MDGTHLSLAQRIASSFATLPQVQAIALGGSQSSGTTDASSDIDLYIYSRTEIPLADREAILEQSGGASKASLGLDYWGPGDEWFDAASGIEVDMVYFDAAWMEAQLQRVLKEYKASLGYSTCLWYTVRHSRSLYDPQGWLVNLQEFAHVEYPEALRTNIITFNHPVLREIIPSYAYQLKKAIHRKDLVSINHRLAALLASYFDILFAFNRQLHPGEKRLVEHAQNRCSKLPDNMVEDIQRLLATGATGDPISQIYMDKLLDSLDSILMSKGFA